MLFRNLYWYGTLKEYFKACRMESWSGWMFVFCLGSILFDLPPIGRGVMFFLSFSLATASIYVLNQYFDRIADQENEVKSDLPVASGRITPERALIFSLLLVIICFVLVFMVDVHLLPLFMVYLGLWTAYSAPPLRFKAVPIADFVVSGIGAGALPFLIGLGVSYQLSANVSFIMLSIMPLILFHSGGHIVQALGDYEADRKTGDCTFVVRYGKNKAVAAASFMFFAAFLLPFTYSALGLVSPLHLLLFFILLPFSLPIGMHYMDLLRGPSTRNVVNLHKVTRKYGTLALVMLCAYILLMKISGL